MTQYRAATWPSAGPELPRTPGAAPMPRRADRLAPGGRRWSGPLLWLSLLLHGLVVVAFLLSPRSTPPPDAGLGAPSVSVILGSATDTPTSPTPTPQAAVGIPDAENVQRTAPPDAPMPPAPVAPAPAPPTLLALRPPSPQAAPALPTAAPSSAEDATAPPLPLPPLPPALVPAPPPPVLQALVQPPQLPPRPRPQTLPRPAPRTAPSGFPAPMFSSLGGALSEASRRATTPSREAAGPVKLGAASAYRPQFDLSGDNLGPGWERLFTDWVNRHKYYPHEAAENGEQGTAAVRIQLDRTGHVRSVDLLERSGSQWLDLALQALFRSQQLPAPPSDAGHDVATVNVQMHYILIR